MNNLSLSHIWVMRFWFLALSLIIIFFHLIPLETAPRKWAPPDLLIALALAWTARRPDFVPALSIAAVMLMADLLFQRPPGLMSLLLVLGCEYVRSRSVGHGETSFLAEWFIVCFAIAAMTLIDRLVLAIMLVERAPLSLHLIQMVLTMAVYPLVALFSETVLGVQARARERRDKRFAVMRRNPKELDTMHRKMSRRTLLLGGGQMAMVAALGMRMRYMQVEQADQFRLLAEENRINIRLLPPARGELFDRTGERLAYNSPSYRIILVPEDAGDVEKVISDLSHLVKLDEEDLNRAMTEMKRSAPFLPITLTDQVSWNEISKIAVNAPALPGVTPEVGLTRVYPRGADLAHVIGYVGPVSDYDLKQIEDPEPVLRIPRFQIGKVGLEAKREDVLRGKAGAKRVEVNATGRVMRELDRREGQSGADLQLTVDAGLQGYVQARLGNESAAAVVIDCENGDLRAICSSPSFDPNLFVRGISVADYRGLTEDPYRPLANKSVQGIYPPGSTFKMITALAALEEGYVNAGDTVWCPGHLEISGRRFHCWKRGGHGHVDLNNSLKQSCDVYYYDIALKVGIDKISEMARRFGLGVRHDIPMSAVAEGLAPNRAWKQRVHDQAWLVGDTANSSIGQGYMLASPMQLAVMSARLATGRSVTPRLVKNLNGIEQPDGSGEPLGINENHLRQIRRAMYDVSNNRRGTAYRSRIIEDAYRMAGKTGTSQVRNITKAERAAGVIRNKDLPWERRDHALFVCFAPYDNPRYAVSVVVEHGGGGSTVAAPIARDVMLQALYGDAPPLSAYPSADRSRIKAQQERLHREYPGVSAPVSDRA